MEQVNNYLLMSLIRVMPDYENFAFDQLAFEWIRRLMQKNDSIFFDMTDVLRVLAEGDEGRLREFGTRRRSGESLVEPQKVMERWLEMNNFLSFLMIDESIHNALLAWPAMTGTVMDIELFAERNRYLSWMGTADAPTFIVYQSGAVEPRFSAPNAIFDYETVCLLREIIASLPEGDPLEMLSMATKLLKSRGYFDESFRYKNNGLQGSVPVCNGDDWFVNSLGIAGVVKTNMDMAAVVTMTDGMLSHCMRHDGNNDHDGMVELVRMMLNRETLHEVVPFVRNRDKETLFDNDYVKGQRSEEKLLQREKEHDDALGAVLRFVSERRIEKLLPNLRWVGP
jgi:hypothetical protein